MAAVQTDAAVPAVIALVGLPGAGKTTLAAALVAAFGLRMVSRDVVRDALFPECRYTPTEQRAAFRAVLLAVEVNCALGVGSVIDGMTFSRAVDLERVEQLARRYDALAVPIWLDVPPHVASERIARDLTRGAHPAADRNPGLVAQVVRRFQAPPTSVAAIDASLPAEVVREQAFEIVRRAMAAAR